MANKKRSKKREEARRKRSQRGWSLRSNRVASVPDAAPESTAEVVPAVPEVDAPAPTSILERIPPVARWGLLVTVAAVIGVLTGVSHTVQLGLTAAVATFLAGAAFLASYLPPSLRRRPGDTAAIGFGRATGHERPDGASDAATPPTASRAARRRARREEGE